MIPEIDWKAEMAALDASLPERLEAIAQSAARSGLHIEELEGKLNKAISALEKVQAFVRDLEPYADQSHTLVPALREACETLAELKGKPMPETRSFPEAANGLPQVPMQAELWAAGCDVETARFVAKQLDREGYRLIKPRDLWAEHKHFEGERRYALRQVLKWIMGETT